MVFKYEYFISISLNELLEVVKHRHFKIRVQMYFGLDYNLKSALCIKHFFLDIIGILVTQTVSGI